MHARPFASQPKRSPRLPSVLRPRDLEARGIPRGHLRTLVRRGEAERIARGLYRLRSAPATEHATLALVCKRIPLGIVCLLTALQVHGIGTQLPRLVWIAIDRKARKPALGDSLPVRIVRYSGQMLRYAVVTRDIEGVPVRITSPARTVVDCFRYRNKIGLDVALEALRETLRRRLATVDEILRAAEVCRVLGVIRPYVESAVA